MKWQKTVTGRAANGSDWQKTKSKKKRATKEVPEKRRKRKKEKREETATQGVHRRTTKGDEDFVQGSAFRLGR